MTATAARPEARSGWGRAPPRHPEPRRRLRTASERLLHDAHVRNGICAAGRAVLQHRPRHDRLDLPALQALFSPVEDHGQRADVSVLIDPDIVVSLPTPLSWLLGVICRHLSHKSAERSRIHALVNGPRLVVTITTTRARATNHHWERGPWRDFLEACRATYDEVLDEKRLVTTITAPLDFEARA